MAEDGNNPSLASTLVNNEQSKAISAVSSFGATAVTESSNLARYIGHILGTTPEDAVGLIIGDPLHAVRTLAAGWYDIKVREILQRRGVKETAPVSPSVALPLVRGAYDESREELRDMWAALLAAAMDPARCMRVRLSFIETLKRFDPYDALILRASCGFMGPDGHPLLIKDHFLADKLGLDLKEVRISLINLSKCECIEYHVVQEFHVSNYGRGLVNAISE